MTVTLEELARQAVRARRMSYSPYSHYQVGAALLCEDGSVYTGCNIESASYTPTNCAERTAVFKAVSEGHRRFLAIAIAGGPQHCPEDALPPAWPCGVCRQVLREFCDPAACSVAVVSGRELLVHRLEELLPHSFGPADLSAPSV